VAPGDIFGFAGVALAGVSAIFMVLRGKILKVVRNLAAIRAVHIAISALAGIFIILHVSYYVSFPINIGIVFGYATFATALIVWLTGSAFLETVKDSLLFHSSFSIVLIALALIHAASSASNIPILFSGVMILSTVSVLVMNVAYYGLKVK